MMSTPTQICESLPSRTCMRLFDCSTMQCVFSRYICQKSSILTFLFLTGLATLCSPDDEEMSCIIPFTVKNGSESRPCFIVGTGVLHSDNLECTEGRLLLVTCGDSSSRLEISASAQVNGYAYAVVEVEGLIAVAVNTSVSLNFAHVAPS